MAVSRFYWSYSLHASFPKILHQLQNFDEVITFTKFSICFSSSLAICLHSYYRYIFSALFGEKYTVYYEQSTSKKLFEIALTFVSTIFLKKINPYNKN